MKKLLLISTLLIFSCSSESGDDSYNECNYEPTLQTNEVTDITLTTAVLNGSISIVSQYCDPYYTEQGFVYSTQQSPTLDDNSLVVEGANITATIENLEPATTYYVRVFLTNALGTWYGNEIYFDTYAFENCNGDLVSTVVYGTQRWTVENACHTTYRDGTPIPYAPPGGFGFIPIGAYFFDPSYPDGILYNQFAILGYDSVGQPTKEFAPEGWHVPTLSEWNTLAEYLISNGYNYDNTTLDNKIAKSLASNFGWNPNTGVSWEGTPGYNQSSNNSSGFNAEAIGFGAYTVGGQGGIFGRGDYSYFCTSTLGVAFGIENYQLGAYAIGTEMIDLSNYDGINLVPFSNFSVRFVKDN